MMAGLGKRIYKIRKNWLSYRYFYSMKIQKWLFVLAMTLSVPLYSKAWGLLGHRVVGGIAEHYLSTRTKAEIRKLLGNESIAMASNWADFIKSDKSFDYLGPWHYINLPSGMTEIQVYKYLQNDTSTDLYTKMNFLTRELKNKKLSKEKQVFYLKLLIHFVGDAHQPMHVGRPEDRGGNNIKLYWFNSPTNLHRIWDEHLIEFQQLSYTEHIAAINFTTPFQKDKWQRQPLNIWIYESYQIAEKLYSEVKSEDKLSYQYNYFHLNMMNQQLLKGGVRLAGLLNDIFGK